MGTCGLNFAAVSGLLGTEGALALAGAAVPAALTPAFVATGMGVYGALLLYSGYGLYQTRSFAKRLSDFKEEDHKAALVWLKSHKGLALRVGKEWAEKIKNHPLDATPKETCSLIRNVKEANFKQQVRHGILLVISILGIATIAAIAVTLGLAVPILFAIGGVIWLTVDCSRLHKWIGDKCWALAKPEDLPSAPKKISWDSAITLPYGKKARARPRDYRK
jgi:hypothetical protein